MPTPTPILEAPAQFDPWTLTEWVERSMLLETADTWTRTAILGSFPANAAPESAEADQMLGEIRRRADLAPQMYPFREKDGVISLADNVDPRLYGFLILASFEKAPFRKRKSNQFNQVNELLDLLVREAMMSYLGRPDSKAVRFGWPVQDGRPKRLRPAMKWIARELGLKTLKLRFAPKHGKDAGVDVVAWRPFASGGGGFSCVLVQNTVAVDYRRKPGDISINRWKQIIDFRSDPQIGLAIPFAVDPEGPYWEEVSFRAQIIIDRLRLIEHLDHESLKLHPEWHDIGVFVPAQRNALVKQMSSTPVRRPKRPKKK